MRKSPQAFKSPPILFFSLAAIIIGITVAVYSASLSAGFVNWDDYGAVVNNAFIRSFGLASVKRMFTTFLSGNWIPLTWLTHAAIYHFWGLDPMMHHLLNVAIHCLNAILVFLIFIRLLALAGRPSYITAAIAAAAWSVHPLNVEPVLWVTEVKGLGNAFFFFLSILAYLSYADSKKFLAWATSLACFVISLLFKPMSVTLPVTLLILDFWPLKRITKGAPRAGILLEKFPFFLVSLVFGAIMIWAQGSAGAVTSIQNLPFFYRILNAFHSVIFYLQKIFIPLKLSPFYPYPYYDQIPSSFGYLSAPFLVILITIACIAFGRRQRGYLLAAWAFFILTLVPVSGIIQIGSAAAADRYTYVPSAAIILLSVGWLLSVRALAAAPLAAIIIFGFLTTKQISIWKDSLALWQYAVKTYPVASDISSGNLGLAYLEAGDNEKAIAMFEKAIQINPTFYLPYNNLGVVYKRKGNFDQAISDLTIAIRLNPRYAEAYNNRGLAYIAKGDYNQAILDFSKAVECDPGYSEAYINRSFAYSKTGIGYQKNPKK